MFNFGNSFANAATAVGSATSFSQIQAALQAQPGLTVSFTFNAANNELGMLVQATSSFNTTLPFSIDQVADNIAHNVQIGGANFLLGGTVGVSGTATAKLQLGLSFDTSRTDAEPHSAR